jgi:hypothetical protein
MWIALAAVTNLPQDTAKEGRMKMNAEIQKNFNYCHVTTHLLPSAQGCQMVYFQTKNPDFCKIWMALEWKMLSSIFYNHL